MEYCKRISIVGQGIGTSLFGIALDWKLEDLQKGIRNAVCCFKKYLKNSSVDSKIKEAAKCRLLSY
jgi:hypothetical protein